MMLIFKKTIRKTWIPLTLVFGIVGCTANITTTKKAPEKRPIYGKIVKSGLFELIRGGSVINDPRTSTGKAFAKPVIRKVDSSTRIQAKKDAYLAYQYRIGNLPEELTWIDLRRVLIHPEMKLPDGSVTTGSDFIIKRRVNVGHQVVAYDGYGLNEGYELVEGDWVFQIWYKNQKLIEQKFVTYKETKKIGPLQGKPLKL